MFGTPGVTKFNQNSVEIKFNQNFIQTNILQDLQICLAYDRLINDHWNGLANAKQESGFTDINNSIKTTSRGEWILRLGSMKPASNKPQTKNHQLN